MEQNRTGLSVSDSGKTSEFRLALTVRYKLDKGNGLDETEYSLSARDSLRYDVNSLLSSVDEERRLLEGLRADLAQRIVSRLR
ncbi:MAG: LPS assembly lipoprotein LptE [Gammaproteobacteria bacterium]